MPEAVYKLVIFKGYKEAWYQLPTEEQDRIWAEVAAADKEAGGETILFCVSRWANEGVPGWGVVKYPSVEAAQQFAANDDLEWWRYAITETFLGTEDRPDDNRGEGEPVG